MVGTEKEARKGSLSRNVEGATNESLDGVQRFDERDNIFARIALDPQTESYAAYYNLHPELENVDRRIRELRQPQIAHSVRERRLPGTPLAKVFSEAAGSIPQFLGNRVDGPVAKERLEVDPVAMAENIKGVGRYLGADEVAIGRLNQAWVYSHNGRWFYDGAKWGDPVALTHPYAITLGFAHNWEMILAGRKPSWACAIDSQNLYSLMAAAAVRLAAYIRALGYPARAHHVRNYQVLQVPIAIDAGMGDLGRLGLLTTKKYGPALRLATVTTELPLAVDRPVDIGMQDFCQKCLKCARACPVGAIPSGEKVVIRGVKKWKLDDTRCFQYWSSLGTNCFACLSVCPWTKPRNLFHRLNAELASRSAVARSALIWLDDLIYGKKPRGHRYPSWIYDKKEPVSLGERVSDLLHRL